MVPLNKDLIMTTALALKDIKYTVKTEQNTLAILNEVNLNIQAGESIAILGNSGCGKTTLLNIMAGLLDPTAGQIQAFDTDITHFTANQKADWRKDNVAFIFQSFELLDNLTAIENICLPLELKAISSAETIAQDFLTQVGLAERANHRPAQLSGGEKQRVAIARAFAEKPRILFADEPTGNLDEKTGDHIAKLMFGLNQNHSTLILVTHDRELASQCDKQYTLHNGKLCT